MPGQLPGLPAGVPKVSEMVKPLTDIEKGITATVKPMIDPLIKPAFQFVSQPLTAMGIKVPMEVLPPVETVAFAAKLIEAGKLPIPTKLPGVEMLPTFPGMPPMGAMFPAQGVGVGGAGAGTGAINSPGVITEAERILPEEAKPGGLVSGMYSLEERRRRMWMSL